jgi:hypothetical protein
MAPILDASSLHNTVIQSLGVLTLPATAADHISAGVLLGWDALSQAPSLT